MLIKLFVIFAFIYHAVKVYRVTDDCMNVLYRSLHGNYTFYLRSRKKRKV